MSEEKKHHGKLSNIMSGAFFRKAKEGETHSSFKTTALIIVGVIVFVSILSGGGGYVLAEKYEGRIGPNIWIADIDVSGMDPEMARQEVEARVEKIITQGLPLTLFGDEQTLPLSTFVSDAVIDDVSIDVDGVIEEAMAISHKETVLTDTLHLASRMFSRTTLYPEVTVNDEALMASLRRLYPEAEIFAENAKFIITQNEKNWEVEATEAINGQEFNPHTFITEVKFPLIHLIENLGSPIPVEPTDVEAQVQKDDAAAFTDEALAILEDAPYTLTHEEPGRTKEWELTSDDLASMLAMDRDENGFFLTLSGDAYETYLDSVAEDVKIEPRNAVFEISDGRVSEFIGSIPGQDLNREETTEALQTALNLSERETTIQIAVNETAPDIATGDVNDLGISELLGVGISDYSNSPANRISNIKNAVRILNGTLIAPDETFSLVKALAPFSYANGFLPELVIKGDKIEPEMGGGACQIGTTTFRAVMNSGLPVIERRNHSLVVNHYNDPTNGNPGTDATIYEVNGEGAPDFKFLNDTGHYILFQAEMLTDTQELRFSFWGTSDGRQGSYTPPIVTRWIGAGEKQEIETLDLEPGTRKCQNSFPGADAHFTYTVVRADGTIEEIVFESHYRALPSICLVGVETLTDPNATTETETSTDDTVPISSTDNSTDSETTDPTEGEAIPAAEENDPISET